MPHSAAFSTSIAHIAVDSRPYEKADRTLKGSIGEYFASEETQRSKICTKINEIIRIFAQRCGMSDPILLLGA